MAAVNVETIITMTEAADISTEKIWLLLQEVTDPKWPVLSVTDLGIIRQVMVQEDGQ